MASQNRNYISVPAQGGAPDGDRRRCRAEEWWGCSCVSVQHLQSGGDRSSPACGYDSVLSWKPPMPPMLILVFADVSVVVTGSSRAFLILITNTAETENFSLQVCLIFLMLLLFG